MLTLINIELTKIFRKWRTYIAFIAIGVLVPIIQVVFYYTGENYLKFFTRNLEGSFLMAGNLLNGYLIANLILNAMFIHIPMLIVLVAGDILAGEATAGTYRILLTKPISRFEIVSSKFISGLIYVFLLLLFMFTLSVLGSLLFFGTGGLVTFHEKLYIFSNDDVLWRFVSAYLFSFLSMSMVFSLAFFFSSLVENAIGPIIAAMAVIIIFIVISALPIDIVENVRPYLFTNYMDKWRNFFSDPIEWSILFESGAILLLHIFGLFFITSIIFYRKDILT